MGLRGLGLLFALTGAASCNSIDTTRIAPAEATLGDDIYGVFCDRLGTSSFPEDLTGASYQSICHYDSTGRYGSTIDVTALPTPVTAAEKAARSLSVAKLTRMAERRSDLIHALNAAMPNTMIPDVTSTDPNAQVSVYHALFILAQELTALYDTNPYVKNGEPLVPAQTRAIARMLEGFVGGGTCAANAKQSCSWDQDCGAGGICQSAARGALSHMWGRQGYRPYQVGLGVVRPALAYPSLRELTTSAISLLGPGGTASPSLQQTLTVVKQELLTASPVVAGLAPFVENVGMPSLCTTTDACQPSRPRSDIEFASALFLSTDPGFSNGAAGQLIALRDRRGLVVPAGNTPGMAGTVPPPFTDLNNDGFADVDNFGRFIGANGMPLTLDPPFVIPGTTTVAGNALGQSMSAASYTYLDTSQTMLAGVVRSLVPLLDPTMLAPAGDPNAWQQEHETLMYALAGAYTLSGARVQATYDYSTEGPGGQKVAYSGFDASTSPLPDLLHAAMQVLADKDSDAILLWMTDLLQNHTSTVARLLAAALNIRAISAQHDMNAAAGTEMPASLAYDVPIWDQMAQQVFRITQHPGLVQGLLAAMADPTVVTPTGNALHMGDAMSKFAHFKDQLTYNKLGTHYDLMTPGGINGPAVNLTVDPNGGDQSDPKTPVDNTMARALTSAGDNRSCLERSLELIHDANGGPACNKNGAVVNTQIDTPLGPISLAYPLFGGTLSECDLFEFPILANFYLDSLLAANHPKRSQLVIKPALLNDIISALSFAISEDDMLQESSDIAGLTQYPEPFALNRLVYFGASTSNPSYQGMPDEDFTNQGKQVDLFVSGTIDPISSAFCPPDALGAPTCPNKTNTLRVRDPNTIFLWERYGFSTYLGPVATAFANAACIPADGADQATCGEDIFGAIIDILDYHWPGPDHGLECDNSNPGTSCSSAGVNRYEPILVDTFAADIIPALNELSQVVTELSLESITVQRGPNAGQTWTGAQVLEKLTTILFDQDYAKSVGMVDRMGNAGTTWTDGTPQAQLTGFTLFADALHKIDTRFASACDCTGLTGQAAATCNANMNTCLADAAARQGQWKRARSQLVDEFLTIVPPPSSGGKYTFQNPATTPMLLATLKLLREQLNANCPGREQTGNCSWAQTDLDTKLAGVIGRPLFAAMSDMTDQIRQDNTSRRQLETFLQFVMQAMSDSGTDLQGVLASANDILQVLVDDGDLSPVLSASAQAANPGSDPQGNGAANAGIAVLKALTNDAYDKYHVMDHVLPNLVTPMENGTNLSPIEIIFDVISDVNRVDATSPAPLASDDYEGITGTVKNFMTDDTRGLEQLYTIIKNRPDQ
jgi:hypothetical protein